MYSLMYSLLKIAVSRILAKIIAKSFCPCLERLQQMSLNISGISPFNDISSFEDHKPIYTSHGAVREKLKLKISYLSLMS